MRKIDLHFAAKSYLDAQQSVVVVIDVLRATSTIAAALANGCRSIIPAAGINKALSTAARLKNVLLAGERNARKPSYFDLGNSPLEFKPEIVSGKTIVLTTTNGTRALVSVQNASEIIMASFLNFDAILQDLLHRQEDILLYCAGNDGAFSLEDTLCASLLIRRLIQSKKDHQLSDAARWALDALEMRFKKEKNSLQELILSVVSQSAHAQKLKALHLEEDIIYCCQLNRYSVVPVWDSSNSIKSKNL